MHFIAVKTKPFDNIIYINVKFIKSFAYITGEDITTIMTADDIYRIQGNIVPDLKKYILGCEGTVGSVVVK